MSKDELEQFAAHQIRQTLKLPATASEVDVFLAILRLYASLQNIRGLVDGLVAMPGEGTR